MLDPGSIAGRSISPSAVLGPELRRRRSLDIFIRLVAIVFKSPLASTHASLLCIASKAFSAFRNDRPVRRLISAMASSAYFGSALRPVPTEKLNSAVRDDFVHVHVRRGTATCLEDINHELVVESPLHNLLRRRNNGLTLLRVQQSQLHVGPRSRELDQSHSPNEFLRKA